MIKNMKTKTIPVSEFKAHFSEEIRAIEETEGLVIELTRHGKVVAVAHAPTPEPPTGSILGIGKGTATLSPDYDPHEPAFSENDWNSGD